MNDAPQRRAYTAWQQEKLRAQDLDMPYVHEPVPGRNALSISEAAHLDAQEYVALHRGQNVGEVQKAFQDFREQMKSSKLEKMDYMTKYVFNPHFNPPANSFTAAATNVYSRGMPGSSREGDTMYRPIPTPRLAPQPVQYKPDDGHDWYYDNIARSAAAAAKIA